MDNAQLLNKLIKIIYLYHYKEFVIHFLQFLANHLNFYSNSHINNYFY